MKPTFIKTWWIATILFGLVFSTGSVSAEVQRTDESLEFAAQLYFWGASIGGTTAVGSDIEIDLNDILDNLEFALMGTVEMKKGRWILATDIIYLDAGKSSDVAPGVEASADITNWVVTPVVGYNIVDTEKSSLDIIGGARYLSIDTELKIDALGARLKESGATWDAIIGTRGSFDIAENWYLFGLLDVGAGDSDLTWQALGGMGYRFDQFNIVAAYRYMSWEFSDDIKAVENLELHGPAIGVQFNF